MNKLVDSADVVEGAIVLNQHLFRLIERFWKFKIPDRNSQIANAFCYLDSVESMTEAMLGLSNKVADNS